MPGRMPPTSQLDWLISTTAMIVLFWSRATRDLLKSFGWGIATLHRLIQRRSCHPRRPPHSISPLEQEGFELSVPRARKSFVLAEGRGRRSDRDARSNKVCGVSGPLIAAATSRAGCHGRDG